MTVSDGRMGFRFMIVKPEQNTSTVVQAVQNRFKCLVHVSRKQNKNNETVKTNSSKRNEHNRPSLSDFHML